MSTLVIKGSLFGSTASCISGCMCHPRRTLQTISPEDWICQQHQRIIDGLMVRSFSTNMKRTGSQQWRQRSALPRVYKTFRFRCDQQTGRRNKSMVKDEENYHLHTAMERSSKNTVIFRLFPFIDADGLIRVWGRIRNADIPYNMKHRIILPRRCKTTEAIIYSIHQSIEHCGRNATLCRLRDGYWVINGNSLVRHLLAKCVRCRILRGKADNPKMANLPSDPL